VRPFDAMDLVVLTNGKIAVVHCLFEDGAWLDDGVNGNKIWIDKYNELEKVKTIRKPRKGGKEARDIVAMLGRIAHRDLLVWYRIAKAGGQLAIYWGKRKSEKVDSFLVFDAAKSMLGVSNE